MTTAVIDGRALADQLRARVAAAVPQFSAHAGRPPGLATVLVGEDPASQVYVRAKGKATREAGMTSFELRLPESVSQKELVAEIARLNGDEAVDGILIQLPLPGGIDEAAVANAVDPAKDVDGFHVANAGKLASGLNGLVPCTPLGCLMLIERQVGELAGLEAVVIGRSNIVGKPMAQLLLRRHCTVTLAHSRTRDLPAVVRRGDIVVAAVGRPALVKGEWLKPGATVIDVGISRIDGKLAGDVDFASASGVAGAITPVPGGVGPMTIAVLMRNTLAAACARAAIALPEDL
ncbi:MAG: bifunctional 5,10-methylenetetrahydrofolate dehydrogenase/5,10-methenyltetrahydrofolate cyclohydrolase [Sphingosinicella sp.]